VEAHPLATLRRPAFSFSLLPFSSIFPREPYHCAFHPSRSIMTFPKRFGHILTISTCFCIVLYYFGSHPLWSRGPPNVSELKDVNERPPEPVHKGPIYKKPSPLKKRPPISENFPFAESLTSRGDLLAVPSWNRPPKPHVPENTPLFIGFTRNWPLLQQAVFSYITSGWPPEDIYVVDNTGTMKSNFPPGQLTLQNPFYLNVQRLTDVFGVNVIYTPTLLSFAQLQNFYIFYAIEHGWDYFWWSHSMYIPIAFLVRYFLKEAV
jgi:hypothetical protein